MLPGNMMSLVLHEPIGVVGQIVPWNFPFLMAAWKLAPVLAAGDCTVFKPSSTTSLTVLELAKLTQDVIPAGVFNVVTGRGSKSGQYILDNPKIQQARVHRIDRGGPRRGPRGGRAPHPGHAGAGRQVREHLSSPTASGT